MPTPTDLVVKSNALLPALARLDLMELRLLAFCISHIKQGDSKFELVRARATDLAEVFELSGDFAYSLVKDLIKRINANPAEYEEDEYDCMSVWFTTFKYGKRGSGDFIFRFNPDLKPYLLGLTENFTSYRIKDVYQFKAASTWKVYEVIRQYKNAGKIEFYLDKFKALIGVSGTYPRFNNLKYYILEPAVKEINASTDIKIQYELMKQGVKVIGIRFFITKNEDTMTRFEKANEARKKSSIQPNADPEFSKLLRDGYKMAPQQAKQIANLVDYHSCKEKALNLLPKLKRRYDALQVKKTSLGGYVFRALREELTQGSLCES